MLNVFSYTGGFSIAAMQGGAEHVASLDSSRRALDLAEEAVGLNDFNAQTHESIEADALAFLKNGVSDYDIVVLDPPAFAKSASLATRPFKGTSGSISARWRRSSQEESFSRLAVPKPLMTDCSPTRSLPQRFKRNENVRILHRLHQPPDHPVSAFHPKAPTSKG